MSGGLAIGFGLRTAILKILLDVGEIFCTAGFLLTIFAVMKKLRSK